MARRPVGDGHVDLGEVAADHVDADEDQAQRFSSGPIVSQISCSRGVRSVGFAAPPRTMLERMSFAPARG